MKTNLLLLDSYRNMDSLVAYAFSFSHRTSRRLKIIYVYDFDWMRKTYSSSTDETNPVILNALVTANKEFEGADSIIRATVAQYLKKHSVDVPVDIIVSDLNRLELLVRETKASPDIILLAGNSQSYTEATNGAIKYPNLIMNMECPVFVLPDNTCYAVLKHIVYATNFHPDDISTLRHLSEMFNATDLKVVVLHNTKDGGFEDQLRWKGFVNLVKEHAGFQNLIPVLQNEKGILDAIEKYVVENDPDLLVMLKEKKSFLKEVFTTSNTQSVLTRFTIPVLV